MKKLRCAWCEGPIEKPRYRGDRVFCRRSCRQAAWRIRKRFTIDERNKRPMKFGYADPPYPGKAYLYKGERTYKGEVDHKKLIASLVGRYDGWALSTGAYALREVLWLCPREAHVCAWFKALPLPNPKAFGIHSNWEPLIVVPGRELVPPTKDWLFAPPARGGGSNLVGRKPEAFVCWMFKLLGMLPGDELADLFPGSGIVGRAWAEICRAKGVA
jgi:hypothetical protein